VVASSGVPFRDGDLEHYPRKFGKYHLLGPLAQGGMGALYLAVGGDRGLERLMVIKTVLPHLADAEYVSRFRDEAKVVVKLSHGNLIPVFDAGLVGGELFLAMDFVEGRDLRAVWNRCAKKQVAFPIDVAVFIVKELCRGLAYAHSFPDLHLVHRDISPPNVLVSYTGEVKLTDFGLAASKLKIEKTAPGIIYGKVAYMSPEQARGEKLDGRSDMYAAAIVLWELLTGRQLFPPGKDQPQDLLARAKNPEPPRPSKRAPRVPVELDEICLRALAPSKDDRYADCDALRMALQGWLAQNAPTTDGTRMAAFLQELFADDIVRERAERNDLLLQVRTRALTLPPTDELRRMIEARGGLGAGIEDRGAGDGGDERGDGEAGDGDPALIHDAPVRKPGSVGRRASDRQDAPGDRRKAPDRRNVPARAGAAERNTGSAALKAAVDDLTDPDLIGAEIDGRYRVLELIGEGGMGKVYLAEHVEIGKRVALKVLHPSYSRMPDLVERFRREARAASKIGHPNIVDVTDSGTTADGSVYFVMEYLEGVELGSVIEREGALDVARALRISGQICRALAAAHRERIIHRDLKPENIFLVTRDGTADVVKVLDFGIAKTTEAEAARERKLTSPGMAMGTPEYMSPEQAAGRPADERCDVYALGAIMYEMVTGIPPYSGDNFMEILTKKATQDPPPPHLVRGELAPAVSDLVMAAMARDPGERPPTMEALEYELNKCLAGRGVAVAQILGMTTDPHVVATLNPGLSMRHLDDAAVVPRAQTMAPAVGRAGTHSGMSELPGMWSGPAMATGQNGLMTSTGRPVTEPSVAAAGASAPLRAQSSPVIAATGPSAAQSSPSLTQSSPQAVRSSSPALGGSGDGLSAGAGEAYTASGAASAAAMIGLAGSSSSQPMIALRRSGWSVLGWLVVAAVLFGGVGALLYAAFGERRAADKAAAGVGAQIADEPARVPAHADGSGSAVGSARAGADPVKDGHREPDAVGSGSDEVHPGVGSGRDDHHNKRPAGRPGGKRIAVAPPAAADDKDAKAIVLLVGRAKQFEASGQWRQARSVYEKLEQTKGYNAGEALYHQAYAAFQSNATGDAERLAERAAHEIGPFKTQAMLLYGDAVFRQGNRERAKAVFLSIYKTQSGADRSTALKKIATVNKALGLPDADGVTADGG
jgi:eukaryotic-like serine/threonine-protein kinase